MNLHAATKFTLLRAWQINWINDRLINLCKLGPRLIRINLRPNLHRLINPSLLSLMSLIQFSLICQALITLVQSSPIYMKMGIQIHTLPELKGGINKICLQDSRMFLVLLLGMAGIEQGWHISLPIYQLGGYIWAPFEISVSVKVSTYKISAIGYRLW